MSDNQPFVGRCGGQGEEVRTAADADLHDDPGPGDAVTDLKRPLRDATPSLENSSSSGWAMIY